MNEKQRLQLQEMIKTNNVEDQTHIIRQLKHSSILRENIAHMRMIKSRFTDKTEIHKECMSTAYFLFTYYTDIFFSYLYDLVRFCDLKKLFQNFDEILNLQ